jgi:5-formyltetrahydrofolate cyclo-ligase
VNKTEARAEARRRLDAVAPEEREGAGVAIAGFLWQLPEVRAAGTMLLYAALPGEVPTAAFAAEARRRGTRLIYPRCLPERRMALHLVGDDEQLETGGSYGILEPPPACPIVHVEEVDVALIPGLAWDRAGTRLGRGAGYYDRLLADPAWRGFRCGIFLSAQELPGLPAGPWDVPLQAVVTEAGVLRIPG